MKTLMLLFLALVGCASRPIDDETTNWKVTLGAWETPTCTGTMTLRPNGVTHDGSPAFAGTWSCGVYGTMASGEIRTDGRVFLNLETTNPGGYNGLRGILQNDDAIVGDLVFDNGNFYTLPFAAYRQ